MTDALKSTTQAAVERIKRDIQSGRYPPGLPLLQRALATELGMSTTPVREALYILETQGLVSILRNRGAVVKAFTIAELREIYEIRKSLEGLAAVHAISNLGPEEYADLLAMAEAGTHCADRTARLDLNHRFHMTIYRASKMPRLVEMISGLRDVTAYYVSQVYETEEGAARAAEGHRTIVSACRNRDPDAAVSAIREHLAHTADQAIAAWQSQRGGSLVGSMIIEEPMVRLKDSNGTR